jgi:FdhE protein
MNDSFERRLARAAELTQQHTECSGLLEFYSRLLRIQERIFADLRNSRQTDPGALSGYFPEVLQLVSRNGPDSLVNFADKCLRTREAGEELLRRFWDTAGSDDQEEPAKFFARSLLQPWAEHLASRGKPDTVQAQPRCPFCSARPVLGVLRGEGDGAKRSLICSLCATEWQYRRVVCPACGEEQKDRLPVYIPADPGYVRIDACDVCRTWLKSVDLTKNGRAVPVVDDLATTALNIWAEEQGYARVETNILGI